MVTIEYTKSFQKQFSKIKDKSFKLKIIKQIEKIIQNPYTGKPMKNIRKGTREVYISPFRLAYLYNNDELKLLFIELYHKDNQ